MKTPRAIKSLVFFASLLVALGMLAYSLRSPRGKGGDRGRLQPQTDSPAIPVAQGKARSGNPSPNEVALTRSLGRMPLSFIENRGQVDSRVAYYVQGRDTTLYFTAEGMTLVQTGQKRGNERSKISKGRLEKASLGRRVPQTPDPASRWVAKLDFVGANPSPKIAATEKLPAVVSYFKGPRESWKSGLSTYGSIVYSDLWPGIDLVYSGTADRLKYTFYVKPGADPAQVRLAYRGVKGIRLNQGGQLEVETPAGGFRDDKPYAYQEVDGRRAEISAAYLLNQGSADGAYGYGFSLGSYDRSRPLVLDPAVLVYAGYIGGDYVDLAGRIAVDSSGNAYVTGDTLSTESSFPVAGGPDLTHNGSYDAFVAKVKADGTGLVYAGYIGGDDEDNGSGIAVDSAGNAYVSGFTSSRQATFPVTVGPDLTYNGGSGDAFVAKVNAAGTALDYCGYIGGAGREYAISIAVDGSGSAYVTGYTESRQDTFPVLVGPDLTFNGGHVMLVGWDVFAAKVKADGTGLVYAGYIGGNGDEYADSIAVDDLGNAYVVGTTNSSESTFPVTVGPDLTFNGGIYSEYGGGYFDVFVAKINAAGSALLYCGYIGGGGNDYSGGIAVDGSGNAYIAGNTDSTQATFPVTVGPDLTYNGAQDAFVAKVNSAGDRLVYCGYIGGSAGDIGKSIAVDRLGNAYVIGDTASTEASFPVTAGPDLTYNGAQDAFVAAVNPAGTALVYCGYIGGSDADYGSGIAVDAAGNVYVAGTTSSAEATFPVTVGPALTYAASYYKGFVAKIALSDGPLNTPTVRPTRTSTNTVTRTPTRTPTNTRTRTPTRTRTRTPTITPTRTRTKTATRTATRTPTRTRTRTPTITPTRTRTRTPTMTPTPTPAYPAPCFNGGGDTDTDGDGLPDVEENKAFLRDMGADCRHKDIFVEVDYMVLHASPGHTHKPKLEAIAKVVKAFADAPVNNPDGRTGIALHVDCGSDCVMFVDQVGKTHLWGMNSKADELTHQQTLGGSKLDWNVVQQIMNANFTQARMGTFRYVIFAHSLGTDDPPTGVTRSDGKVFIVSLGGTPTQIGTTMEQAGVFMHELGHCLGLDHGGSDGVNLKPNYLSVMNYSFIFSGLNVGGADGKFDYSRFELPELNELSLNEAAGLNGGVALTAYGTRHMCPDELFTRVAPANGPIDWNCKNGSNETNVSADVNGDSRCVGPGPDEHLDSDGFIIFDDTIVNLRVSPNQTKRLSYIMDGLDRRCKTGKLLSSDDEQLREVLSDEPIFLRSHDDWAELVFSRGLPAQRGRASSAALPKENQEEITVEIDSRIPKLQKVTVASPGLMELQAGSSMDLVFTITNGGIQNDNYTLAVSSNVSWGSMTIVPSILSLTSGASAQFTIHVTVPSGTPAGTVGHFTIKATSGNAPGVEDTGDAAVTSVPANTLTVTPTRTPTNTRTATLTRALTIPTSARTATPSRTSTRTPTSGALN